MNKTINQDGEIIICVGQEFLRWQIEHYTQRLAEAKTTEEKAFLRKTRWQLKQKLNSLLN